MSRRLLLLLDLVLVLVAGGLAFRLSQTWTAPRPLPSARAAAAAPRPLEASQEEPVTRSPLATYTVVATKNLFSPTRDESQPTPAAQAAGTTPAAQRFSLYGVVLRPEGALAYLEDPRTRKVYAYKVGDLVGDGRLTEILEDRVVITRAGERVEVLLHDPGKPKGPPTARQPAASPRRVEPRPPVPGAPRVVLPRSPGAPTIETPEVAPSPEGPAPEESESEGAR